MTAPLRSIVGEVGTPLVLTMNVATGWSDAAVGDLCGLSTSADMTITDTVASARVFAKILTLAGTAGTDQIATVEVYGGFTAVRKMTAGGTIAAGASVKIDSSGGDQTVLTTTYAASWGTALEAATDTTVLHVLV